MTRIISIVGGLQPSTPTIGTATDGGTGTSANVAFTASSYIGKGTITYTATSSPGGFTGTGSSSPISVTGLTTGTAYTFTVVGTTNYGVSSLTSGSSNSVTPVNPDSGSMFPLGAVTVGPAGAASITFSSIPSTYTHLQIRGITKSARSGTARNDLIIKLNGSSTTYAHHQLYGDGSSAAALGTASTTQGLLGINCVPSSGYTSQFGVVVADILDYLSTNKNKTIRSLAGTDNNGAGFISLSSALWYATPVAITSIALTIDGAYNFEQYSQFALYGIKGA